MQPRYLTKSKFKLAIECPTKLYYAGKKEYYNKKKDDDFLQALAEGGFQVGELAQCYYPDGVLTKVPRVPAKCSGFGWRLAGLAGLAMLSG